MTGTDPPFLTSALDGGEWSDSRPDRFIPGKRTAGIHWTGVWVSRSGHCGTEKNFLPLPEIEPLSSIQQTVTKSTEPSQLVLNKILVLFESINIVSHMAIARQQLGKYIFEVRLSTIEGHALPGNVSLNTFLQQRISTQ
jgi:hypothetical protein